MKLTIRLRNTGYAAMFNARGFRWATDADEANRIVTELGVDMFGAQSMAPSGKAASSGIQRRT